MRLGHKLKTALSFTPDQWKIFLTAYVLLLKARFLVYFFSPTLVQKALSHSPSPVPLQGERAKSPEGASPLFGVGVRGPKKELLNLFRLAWRYQWPRPKCLVTSLARQTVLAEYGFSEELRIGVEKQNDAIQVHAWSEELRTDRPGPGFPETSFQVIEPLSKS